MDRTDGGQFAQGNPGGPGGRRRGSGRRPDTWKRIINRALTDGCTEDDLVEAVAAVVSEAKTGNVQAFNALLDRIVGKPMQPVQHEGGDPLKPVIIKQTYDELRNLPPDELLRLYREALGSS